MLSTDFETLAKQIQGSQLLSYHFENKQVRFHLFHPKTSRLYCFNLTTDTIHGRSISSDPLRSVCSIRLIDLQQRLDMKHDRYFPPTESKLILQDAKERVSLAYGRRCAEYRWLLNLEGEYPLLSCLVRDLDEIQWDFE